MLQKYYYNASIMPDAPDIALCSKLCWHNTTDPNQWENVYGGSGSLI